MVPSADKSLESGLIGPALKSAVQNDTKVTVILDGTFSYPSSFLEEAFGVLVQQGFSKEDIGHLEIVAHSSRMQHHKITAERSIKDQLNFGKRN
ncbi:STAS-like domain-containing protein [Candidatus Phyllobacterium onerii]|uniref:STAS-like domain-containing protein n=1 Tax=Candidatus Phyllobacterium onerii TaxID=3020828 RepID=UPI003A86085A